MKKFFYRVPAKLLCLILAAASLFATVVSGIALAVLLYLDGYRYSQREFREEFLSDRYGYLTDQVVAMFRDQGYYFQSNLDRLQESVPFTCTLQADGAELYSDFTGKEGIATFSEVITYTTNTYDDVNYYVQIYLQEPALGSDLETQLLLLDFAYDFRIPIIPIFLGGALISCLLCVFLCCSAGFSGERGPKSSFFDRIPLELFPIFAVFLLLFENAALHIAPAQLWFCLLCLGIFLAVDLVFALVAMMTLAVRIKTETLGTTSFCGKAWRYLGSSRKWFLRLWEDLRLAPKVAFVMTAIALFDLILATVLDFTECLAAFLIEGLVLAGLLIWYAASLWRLEKDLEKIAEGKLDSRCDLSRLPPGLRSFGEKLNQSAKGLECAVEEKLRSERFKTELITNVSHDIKTPLTSIVNYVDLMKKEEVENETLKEYLEVLDRQSHRLKKLTEDLVESSKAASGALSVHLERCDAGVLLEQAMGEHQAALEEAGLKPQLILPEESVFIMADGKRLWRVMDNLFQNIKKYALVGTRVYVSLELREDKVDMVFRNISAEPIAVSAEDLTERFVRGDASRNSEGSGLGLSIARSLTQLQKGDLSLIVDGDLFKAVITFDRIHS